ncbi:hypothetical protein [Streptomyces albicerus]|uniref:hypothetical protein n=1 Tax=Streptomyces albicerus TaxID=2569859 RepID=UPI00124B06E0|nr:hypothetical protein [Streptomyces albicerus]
MTISPLVLAAKKVIDAAWLHGDAYDLSSQAAFALESAQLLMSPETAAELARLRERFNASPAELSPEQRTALDEQLGDAKPASTELVVSFGKAIRNRRDHEHPTWEDFYCLNLSSYMGERMAPVLRRLLDVEAEAAQLRARLAEFERPVGEDPIAYAVVGAVAVEPHAFEAEYQGESDAKRRLPNCKECGRPAVDPAHDEDVRPQVQKLRALLAGQRAQAGERQ